MRAGSIAIQLDEARAFRPANVVSQIALLDQTLSRLEQGDPVRPLFLPETTAIREQFNTVSAIWHSVLKPAIAQNVAAQRMKGA